MKKVFLILILSLLVNNKSFSNTTGTGDLKISQGAMRWVLQYFGEVNPMFLAVSKSGRYSWYSYCPAGQSCRFDPTLALQGCKKVSNERCYVFARRNKIVWDNANIKISRKTSKSEIRAILTDLGFLGDKKTSTTTSSSSETKPKITKKKKVENKDVVKQIQELNDLFKSGVISKEEFDKAKKKILE